MLKLLQDLEVPEAGAATFECELSRPSAEVKWLKVRAPVLPVQADGHISHVPPSLPGCAQGGGQQPSRP